MDNMTKIPKGYGFVSFSTPAMAEECIETSHHSIDGQEVTVRKAIARGTRGPDRGGRGGGGQFGGGYGRGQSYSGGGQAGGGPQKIFLGGIPAGSEEDAITEMFEKFLNQKGSVKEVDLKRNRETDTPRGFAFITFHDPKHVENVATAHFFILNGKSVEAKICENKPPQNKRWEQGGAGGYFGGGGGGGSYGSYDYSGGGGNYGSGSYGNYGSGGSRGYSGGAYGSGDAYGNYSSGGTGGYAGGYQQTQNGGSSGYDSSAAYGGGGYGNTYQAGGYSYQQPQGRGQSYQGQSSQQGYSNSYTR